MGEIIEIEALGLVPPGEGGIAAERGETVLGGRLPVNPSGGLESRGHPIGATGALITVKALHELQRTGGRYALVTMCIGGGQGIAAVFERI
mgnify:CR=1 FL=1